MTATDFIRRALLDHVFSGVYAPPASLYAGLSTTTPASDGTGVTEPGFNYARTVVTAATMNPAVIVIVSGEKANALPIVYPTASGSWGSITYALLYDAITGGNLLWFMQDTTPLNVTVGNQPFHSTSNYTLRLSSLSDFLMLALLDHVFTDPAYVPPATNLYMALSSTAPNSDGTNVTEPVAASYARATLVRAEMSLAVTQGNDTFVENLRLIQFPVPEEDWGADPTHWALYDAVTGGNLLMFGALAFVESFRVGKQRRFLPGDFRAIFTTIV